MTAPSPPDGRIFSPSIHHSSASPSPEPSLAAPPTAYYPGTRELLSTRGRALSAATSPQNASPRHITPHIGAKQSVDLERKPSASYGHHRNTSIIHGAQHSRNPSLLSTSNVSPLSPNKVVAHSAGPDGPTYAPALVPGLKKSPSMSNVAGGFANGSATSVNRSFGSSTSQRRSDRMSSTKTRLPKDHTRSVSRAQLPSGEDVKTVGELALHHLFTSFIAEADERIERCVPRQGRAEVKVESVCGSGADLAFDQLLLSLGHINRHDPSPLINSVIQWRKTKADVANTKHAELQRLLEMLNLTQRPSANGLASPPTSPPGAEEVAQLQHAVAMSERRSGVSIYILCRVLIDVLSQTTLPELNGRDNTAARLEEVIYGQLQNADPDHLAQSFRRANWVIRGQVVGVMSGLRFKEVAKRFINDLREAQKKLSIKGLSDPRLASKTALLVQSMRWLKVQSCPESAWQDSCDMLLELAKFFAEVHGRIMKYAYAELFEHLLLPVAATATVELNIPKWREVLAIVQPRVTQMLPKADHWPHVFPLQAVLLCVSPADQFATQWLPLVSTFQPRARDRASRSHALKAICRLVWRYVYKCTESPNAVSKKLDEVVKLVFQGGKRVLISTDPVIADPLIQLIRIIGFKYQDLCFRTIIFPLMNSEQLLDSQLKIENLDPERTVIAIRAFLAIMTDLEKGEAPAFPTRFDCDALLDPASRAPISHRRTKSQGAVVSSGRIERLSRPVSTDNFNDISKEYYEKFCRILGNLTIICDNTFGGQAVLDEKLSTQTPKTPMAEAFTFNKRDDLAIPTDLRQNHYELLHVAVEALPRCLSPQIQINPLVNLLCTGTAHVESQIAGSSAQSLKSIARQSHAQPVTIGFARFIFNFDDRYATVSDGSLLGPGHIENTLMLYVELLQIWVEEIQRKTWKAVQDPAHEDHGVRMLPLDLSGILAHVDEVESHGLFFLCSPSPVVRAVAVNVLRLVTKFDKALGKPSPRIIDILEGSTDKVISITDERLSVAERSRLQNGLRKGSTTSTLVELCSSDIEHDANLWMKIFPNLVRLSSQECLHAVALTRELVCQRLSHSYRTIHALVEMNKPTIVAPFEQTAPIGRSGARFNTSSSDVIIEQWRIHLIFACTTLTNIGSSNLHPTSSGRESQHTRKSSKSSATSSNQEKIANATELFSRVVKFLAVPNAQVRHAAVDGLGATNVTLFHALLESLQPYVAECNGEVKARNAAHQRNANPPARTRRTDLLRTETTHLLALVSHHLQVQSPDDDYALTYLLDYSKYTRLFLSDTEIQAELDFQKLRTYFCSLTENIFEYTRHLKEPSRYVSFQSRQANFSLMENWCGFSPNESELRRREDHIRRSILERELDLRNRGVMSSAFQKDKSELQTAALSGMATLCAGPLTFTADNRTLMQFNIRRMLSWMEMIFATPSDRNHTIGRKALRNLITHNIDEPSLIAQTMRMCYISKSPKALASYFDVVAKVFTEHGDASIPYWKVICAALYTLGNEDSEIRMKSARLLRTFEERKQSSSKLQDLDISVSDKTTAVYKLAQFEISRRLAKQHQELAFHVFSEFSAYFKELEPDHQRNMVTAMLPWIQSIHLKLDPAGGLTATTHMLLVNLFEITAKSSITLHNEIQALWQALATGGYDGNVSLALEFIIELCLERKEQGYIHYAKQIVVFLSQTPAGQGVVDHLLLQIAPRTMTADGPPRVRPPLESMPLPYVAEIASAVPGGGKLNGLSLGQLCMILLVDLVVAPFTLPVEQFVPLLHVVLVKWDHQASIIQDQAREMLVHLIHELVISKIQPGLTLVDSQAIEAFIESVRRRDQTIAWSKDDIEDVPEAMAFVVEQVLMFFSAVYPQIRQDWSKLSMYWAACPNLHVACRSYQLFRCMRAKADQHMFADIVQRLSTTIADLGNSHVQMYALENLITLRTCITSSSPQELLQCPEIFWTICAALNTSSEREFQEALRMLNVMLGKLDLSDESVIQALEAVRPDARVFGRLPSLHELIHKGMRSSRSMDESLAMLERLTKLPACGIVGREDRLLFTVLANLPRYLHYFEDPGSDVTFLASAEQLASFPEPQHLLKLQRTLLDFGRSRYRCQEDFLQQCMSGLREAINPANEFHVLVFLMGMVNNECSWFKVKTMQILCEVIPTIDMRNQDIACHGPDLISPLLRLLQTEHCTQALQVLDNVIHMTGTPNDSKHLRMSMAGSHSSRATRKEFDNTKSLYGIPEQSGWSVPMPAVHSAQTRSLLVTLHQSMSTLNGLTEVATTPDLEFTHDEDELSYFTERTVTVDSMDTTVVEGNMNDLSMQLDSLDDFFDDAAGTPSTPGSPSSPHPPRYPTGLVEEREALYDQQALPILHKSLKRNTSVNSFQHGLADFRYPQSREPAVMNPTAFAYNETLSVNRPGLHNRSVTTSVLTLKPSPPHNGENGTYYDDSTDREQSSFSDDDATIGRAHTAEEAQPVQTNSMMTSVRQGILRRLTGGSGGRGNRETMRAGRPPKSPKGIPKVPTITHVNGSMTPDA